MSTLVRPARGVLNSLIDSIRMTARAMAEAEQAVVQSMPSQRKKLTGRAFYESIGKPKYIVAPMVDRSEFAWRMLTRSYMSDEESKRVLAYSPMLHARLFGQAARFRDEHFQPTKQSLTTKTVSQAERWLDGNPKFDRPLFVQFCANKPDELFEAAQYVAPYCDAVDLNLGCPQGIAKAGKYGAFLQEDWDTIHKLINKLHNDLSVPVTAKMRILETKEKTLEYAKMILSAGANILTVHGRRREQKGHNTGVADWTYIRYLRDNLPPETVIFANGNILNGGDMETCLEATGADGIMSAEGNLSDPTLFAKPPLDLKSLEYWRGANGDGGYRIDGVFRRYLDIIYRYVLEKEPPQRLPLFDPTNPVMEEKSELSPELNEVEEGPPKKKQKRNNDARQSPSLKYMRGHLFQLLRPMLALHTDIRDTLARTAVGDMEEFEKILRMVEKVTKRGLLEEATDETKVAEDAVHLEKELTETEKVAKKYRRPWWVCQPHVRPLPEDAIKLGSMQLSKKEKARREAETEKKIRDADGDVKRSSDDGRQIDVGAADEITKAAVVCG